MASLSFFILGILRIQLSSSSKVLMINLLSCALFCLRDYIFQSKHTDFKPKQSNRSKFS